MSDVHDMSYYGKCMVGGIFACGLTHAIVCPMDIVKCRRQVSSHLIVSFFHVLTFVALSRSIQISQHPSVQVSREFQPKKA